MSVFRDIVFTNWRNKGVALFFAVTIWGVAYQSEFSEETVSIRVALVPKQEAQIILRKTAARVEDGQFRPFDGDIKILVNGTRKQVEAFKNSVHERFKIEVDATADTSEKPSKYVFSRQDFRPETFSLIQIERFNPPFVLMEFDAREQRELPVKIHYELPSSGLGEELAKVDPDVVLVSGPARLMDKIQVLAEPELGRGQNKLSFDGVVPLKLVPQETDDGLQVSKLVTIDGPSRDAKLAVRLRAKQAEFPSERIPIRFATPPDFRYTVLFDDREIPVTFRGPEREIKRLQVDVGKPDFFLTFKLPVESLTGEEEGLTFAEDGLLLHGGYSGDVQILQHPTRHREGLWSYQLVPNQLADEGGL